MAAKLLVIEPPVGANLNPERYPVQRYEQEFPDGSQGVEDFAERMKAQWAKSWRVPVANVVMSLTDIT